MTVLRDENYKQICVMHSTILEPKEYSLFENDIVDLFGLKHPIRIIGNIKTLRGAGGPGGRIDLFFIVHKHDVIKMANIKRIQHGIRWWEDVLVNLGRKEQKIYPKYFRDMYPPI